ncbi:anti-anti-sigma factor [Bacterioplanes sanyensis]|uniref:Anti-anti-sigma factor n=1 Tax=Bacterioplanes sanyensis TaxID=1249553 RepID=A0A222FLU9_9GAMM|nr:STAS domain-containing protein [Bacterioplanes sanyensis]ASP39739.1 anti-anti-sigma factor [Bacterioplanes sanyensis]
MTSGEVYVAFVDGVHIVRLVGDVRLNLCSALERYLDDILARPDFHQVVVDLSAASGVDSTTLGQIAKIAILAQERFGIRPTVVTPNPDITRLLLSMGFDQVFNLVREPIDTDAEFEQWAAREVSEAQAREQVIDAHKVLMSLNKSNEHAFKELVDSLEADRRDAQSNNS